MDWGSPMKRELLTEPGKGITLFLTWGVGGFLLNSVLLSKGTCSLVYSGVSVSLVLLQAVWPIDFCFSVGTLAPFHGYGCMNLQRPVTVEPLNEDFLKMRTPRHSCRALNIRYPGTPLYSGHLLVSMKSPHPLSTLDNLVS